MGVYLIVGNTIQVEISFYYYYYFLLLFIIIIILLCYYYYFIVFLLLLFYCFLLLLFYYFLLLFSTDIDLYGILFVYIKGTNIYFVDVYLIVKTTIL